jgi:hypothetical protein
VDPTQVIEPYELSYEAMTQSERERWIATLRSHFETFIQAGLQRVVMFAGSGYRMAVQQALEGRSITVTPHPRWKQLCNEVFR